MLLGEVFDPWNVNRNSDDILEEVATSFCGFTTLCSKAGRYLVIKESGGEVCIIPDACAQYECFYSTDYRVAASHAGLIGEYYTTKEWMGPVADLYRRIEFTDQIPVGTTTRFKNVRHLLPNHYLSLSKQRAIRFFPTSSNPVGNLELETASEQWAELLRRIATAMGKRHDLALPLTAGYDSRLLLAAFRNNDFRLFIYDHPEMKRGHFDKDVAIKIAERTGIDINIVSYDPEINSEKEKLLDNIPERPRSKRIGSLINGNLRNFGSEVILNGNIGEIGRSYYPVIPANDARNMAICLGYIKEPFVQYQIGNWLKELDIQSLGEQNLMDLFYWEFRMGTWGAKAMTEGNQFSSVLSPLNCHRILSTMLSVDKRYRKPYRNDLFKSIIEKLDPRLNRFPFNPNKKTAVIKAMIDLGIYEIYRKRRCKAPF